MKQNIEKFAEPKVEVITVQKDDVIKTSRLNLINADYGNDFGAFKPTWLVNGL